MDYFVIDKTVIHYFILGDARNEQDRDTSHRLSTKSWFCILVTIQNMFSYIKAQIFHFKPKWNFKNSNLHTMLVNTLIGGKTVVLRLVFYLKLLECLTWIQNYLTTRSYFKIELGLNLRHFRALIFTLEF